MMTPIFVYGSLRPGGWNNPIITRTTPGLDWVYTGRDTLPGADLFSLRDSFPVLKEGSGTVKGDVYSVSENILNHLDRLEGHPHFYRRTPVTLGSGLRAETYVFQGSHAGLPLVPEGDWLEFRKDHPWLKP